MEDINLLDDVYEEFEREMIEEAIAYDEHLEEIRRNEKVMKIIDDLNEISFVKENIKKGAVAYEITYEIDEEKDVMKVTSFKLKGGQKDIPRTTSKNTITKMVDDEKLRGAIDFIRIHYLPIPDKCLEGYVALLFMIMLREGTRVFDADTVFGKISDKLIYRE